MKKIRIKATRGYMGRTYIEGKAYRVVDRDADAEIAHDEVAKSHALHMVSLDMADQVKDRSRRPARATVKRPAKAARKAAPASPAEEPAKAEPAK